MVKYSELLLLLVTCPIPVFTAKIWLLRRSWDGVPFLSLPSSKLGRILVGLAMLCLLPVCWVLLLAFVIDPFGISRMTQALFTIALMADAFLVYLWLATIRISRTAEVWIKPEILDCLMIRDKHGQYAIALKDAEIKVKRPLYGPGDVQVFNYLIKTDNLNLNLAIPWDSTMGVDVKYADTVRSCGGLLAQGSPGQLANLHRLLQGFAF